MHIGPCRTTACFNLFFFNQIPFVVIKQSFHAHAAALPALQQLELHGCRRITPGAVPVLARMAPSLDLLHMSGLRLFASGCVACSFSFHSSFFFFLL
jgi:hypothetical protein